MRTHVNGPNTSLDWVLSHWAYCTVLTFVFVCVYIACMCSIVTDDVDLVGLKPDP